MIVQRRGEVRLPQFLHHLQLDLAGLRLDGADVDRHQPSLRDVLPAVRQARQIRCQLHEAAVGLTAADDARYVNGIDPEKDVTVEFKSEHAEVVSALVQDQTAVGLLPQPFVTTALMKNDKLKVALDLNKLWEDSMDDGSKLVTGVVIANNEFVQDHADKVNDFMDAYKESVDFVNSDTEAAAQIIGDHDIIAKEVAQKAIPDCSIVFIEGDEMKTMLSGYLATLDDQNPEIIGGQLPDDAFYYKR